MLFKSVRLTLIALAAALVQATAAVPYPDAIPADTVSLPVTDTVLTQNSNAADTVPAAATLQEVVQISTPEIDVADMAEPAADDPLCDSLTEASALETSHDTAPVRHPIDTAARIIRMPAEGKRAARGIYQYMFIPKGEWIGGIQFSYLYFSSQESEYLLLLNGLDAHGTVSRVTPFLGYFYRRNNCLGVQFSYRYISAKVDAADFKLANDDDFSFSLKNVNAKQESYGIAMFHRSYVGLDLRGRFALFNETRISMLTGTTRFEFDDNSQDSYTRNRQVGISFHPGLAVFVMDHFSLHASIGFGGIRFNTARFYHKGLYEGKHSNIKANFRINITDITIGLTVHMWTNNKKS